MNNSFILKIDDREYKPIKNIYFNNKEYLYLVDKDDYRVYVIGEIKDNDFVIVEDKNLLRKLVLELYKTNNYKD
jgi:hypothetical protein